LNQGVEWTSIKPRSDIDVGALQDLLTSYGQVGRDDVAFVQNLIAFGKDGLQNGQRGC